MFRWPLAITSLFVAVCSYAQVAPPARFKATANFANVAKGENIEVSFTYAGDDMVSFKKPDLDQFDIVTGPMQTKSDMMHMVDGKPVSTVSVKMTYILKARQTGTLLIGKAKAVTKDNQEYYTEPFTITVVESTAINNGAGNYKPLSDAALTSSPELMYSKHRYVVATGPVLYYEGKKKAMEPNELLAAIKTSMGAQAEAADIGIYLWDNLPRIYLAANDTNGMQASLAKLYNGLGDGVYFTRITATGAPMYGENALMLKKLNLYYLSFERLKPWLAGMGKDTTQPRRLFITWTMRNRQEAKEFSARVEAKGYTVDSTHELLSKPEGRVLYCNVTISKTVELNDQALRTAANEMLEEAERLHGSFSLLTADKR